MVRKPVLQPVGPRPALYFVDAAWTSWIGGLVVRAIGAWQRRVARKRGVRAPLTGAVTFVQRFGGLVNLNVHFHLVTWFRVVTTCHIVAPTNSGAAGVVDIVTRAVDRHAMVSDPIPPARSIAPRSPALFIGRRTELDRFAEATFHIRLVLIYGVAGVGKTSFALRAAEELASRVHGQVAHHVCRSGESLASIAHAVVGAGVMADPLEALARAASATPTILVLDDAHRTDDHTFVDALIHLAVKRLPLWLIVTSREALPLSPSAADHLVLRLAGLSGDETVELWTRLENLYGRPTRPFDEAIAQRSGNPLLLKQAFAAPASLPADPLGIAALPEFDREILVEICTFRGPAPLGVLTASRDPAEVQAALDRLARRFLIELTPGVGTVHDLVRELVAASSWAPIADHHGRAADYYRALPRTDAIQLELLYHATASGDDATAVAILREYASQLRRVLPPTAIVERDLASALELLGTRTRLAPELLLLRARITARQGRVRDAYDQVTASPIDDPLADLDRGEMAFILGRFDEAVEPLSRAAMSEQLALPPRLWAVTIWVDALRGRGAWDEIDTALRRAVPLFTTTGPLGRGIRAWLEGILAHDAEDYERAAAALSDARRAFEGAPFLPARIPTLASFERTVAAAAGHAAVGTQEASAIFEETLFIRLVARILHAAELLYRGRVKEAAQLASTMMEACAAFPPLEGWAGWVWGEAARYTSSLAEIAERLEPLLRTAEESGMVRNAVRLAATIASAWLAMGEIERAVALARAALQRAERVPGTAARLWSIIALGQASCGGRPRRRVFEGTKGIDAAELALANAELDLMAGRTETARTAVLAVEQVALRAGWDLFACRAELLLSEAAVAVGHEDRSMLDAARAKSERFGYVALSLRAELIEASLLRGRDAAAATKLLNQIATRADELGLRVEADAARAATSKGPNDRTTWGVQVAKRLDLTNPLMFRLREPTGSRALTARKVAAFDARTYLVIDLVRRRIKVGKRWVDLARRGSLVDVIRALAVTPGVVVPVEELARVAWGIEYHPLRHRGRIVMAISRLRKLIGNATIVGHEGGYAIGPREWTVLEPLDASG